MVPAIFSFHFQGQGQRSKVTALEYMGSLIMSLFLVVCLLKEVPNLVISKVDTSPQLLMQFSNDLGLPTLKVKVIYQNLSKNTQKLVINHVYGRTRSR